MKSLFFIFLYLILHCDSSLSSTIDCKFRDGTFIAVGRIYQCVVDSDPNITTPESAKIDSFNGPHQRSKEDNDVLGFYAGRRTIQYFPNGLQKFPNLKSIQILNCQLKEIHQSDLKPFADLILIYMESNSIEVLEEGLFAYNSNLKVIGFAHNKIIHIDPNVFDHLTQLSDFLFNAASCISTTVYSSIDKVKDAVKLVKARCVSTDFMDLVEKVKKLEDQTESLGTEEFEEKLTILENELKNSKFSGFLPISSKFEKLRKLSKKSGRLTTNFSPVTPIIPKKHEICSQTDSDVNSTSKMTELMSNQLSDIKSSINNLELTQQTFQTSQKSFQDSTTTSINTISSELKTTQESVKSLKDEIKESVSDTIAIISDVKTSQIEAQASLSKLKTTQNEIKVSINDLKALMMNNEDCGGKFSGKLESLEEKFMNFEAKSAENFDKIERSLTNVGHKMFVNFDEKFKGIEKKLMKKFEELLLDNLGKILEDKLNEVMNDKLEIKQ